MATKTWRINHRLDALPVGTVTLTYDDGTKIIKANITGKPSTEWGKVTSTDTSSTPAVYKGQELVSTSREFTIWQGGKTLVCSLDPIREAVEGAATADGGGSDTPGGSWTATDGG